MNGPNDPTGPGHGGPNPPTGRRASILREIERVENEQARAKQLSREMHEFFADATRNAASILSQLSDSQQQSEAATEEMNEFLHQTANKMQSFVQQMQPEVGEIAPQAEPKKPNIRFSENDHLDLSGGPDLTPDDPVSEGIPNLPQLSSLPDLKAPEPKARPKSRPAPPAADPIMAWFLRLADDDRLLRTMLKAVVKQEYMTKDEAIAIYPFARKLRD